MGTTYNIKVVGLQVDTVLLQNQIDQRLGELNMTFSTYVADSEISVINRTPHKKHLMSEEMATVIDISHRVYEISDGAFDVTVGPLVNLWGFGPGSRLRMIPDDESLESMMNRIGFDKTRIERGEIQLPKFFAIDLSAVAKGYAVDEIASLLDEVGASNYMVEIGGEVKTKGKNSRGSDWVIGIEAPDPEDRRIYRTLPVFNLALATSGDYRNFFEHSGVLYSHTIDPRTGWPVSHNLGSVTVLHESAAMADALATAFSVLGGEETLRIADEKNLMVFAIIREGNSFGVLMSRALAKYLDNR